MPVVEFRKDAGIVPDERPEPVWVPHIDNEMDMIGHHTDTQDLDPVSAGNDRDDRK
jgi:hypothetical protein